MTLHPTTHQRQSSDLRRSMTIAAYAVTSETLRISPAAAITGQHQSYCEVTGIAAIIAKRLLGVTAREFAETLGLPVRHVANERCRMRVQRFKIAMCEHAMKCFVHGRDGSAAPLKNESEKS